jgi:nucleotide-binding universal stress UspA family protein
LNLWEVTVNSTKIVVGTDASPPSTEALRWAAHEARRRGAELDVVLAYHWRLPGAALTASPDVIEQVKELTATAVDTAVAQARDAEPDIRVSSRAVHGEPGPVLVQAGEEAGLLVVGNRGGGGFTSLLAGSVSVHVATHAPCPVAIVRGRADNDTGPVIVGVDGSPSADHALNIVFEEAARRHTGVAVVRTYDAPLQPWTIGVAPLRYEHEIAAEQLRRELTTHVAVWRDKYPDVPVELVVERGGPGAILTGMSWRAQLIVVGTRGHGAPTELFPSSVGLQLVHHAECPVLIARSNAMA